MGNRGWVIEYQLDSINTIMAPIFYIDTSSICIVSIRNKVDTPSPFPQVIMIFKNYNETLKS